MGSRASKTTRSIFTAASKLFDDLHFTKVRMEDIAEKAGVSKVTLYRYFETKDDLYLELLRDIGRDYLVQLRRADASVQGCRARLIALTKVALDFFAERKHLIKLLDRAGIDCERSTNFPWLEVQQEFFRMVQGIFSEGVTRQEFLVDDLELAVRGLLGLMRFTFLYPCSQVPPEQIPGKIIGMLIRPAISLSSTQAA